MGHDEMNASHGSWVKGLVGHMGHESLSLTHLQLCLQVCQIRRNRIGQNNGLVNLHWLDYCFVLFYFTLLLIYGCRVVYYVCMSPLMCLYSCIIDSQKGVIGKFSLYYLLGVQQSFLNQLHLVRQNLLLSWQLCGLPLFQCFQK